MTVSVAYVQKCTFARYRSSHCAEGACAYVKCGWRSGGGGDLPK